MTCFAGALGRLLHRVLLRLVEQRKRFLENEILARLLLLGITIEDRLRGQIDRVDRARDGTVIAYDYKLSKGAGLDDMAEGRALQLHVYLSALEQLLVPGSEIAGGGYYTIKGLGARRNQGLYRVMMKDYTGVGGGTSSSLSDTEWKRIRGEMQERIWEFIDGMRSGGFAVAPSAPENTCPHCDFSAVCRYEKFRIRKKQGGGPG